VIIKKHEPQMQNNNRHTGMPLWIRSFEPSSSVITLLTLQK